MENDEITKQIMGLDDEVLSRIAFTSPWQFDSNAGGYKDPDGFSVATPTSKDDTAQDRAKIQKECWDKFQANPQVNTAVRDTMGRLAGLGFGFVSDIYEIQEVLDEINFDKRNRLYSFWPKFLGRSKIEGELYLCFSCHDDGFVEVDFLDPSGICSGGDDDTGIIYHPYKTIMPLFYNISRGNEIDQVPSIYIARYPELIKVAKDSNSDFSVSKQQRNKSRKNIWKQFGGFYRFIVNWDQGLLTRRTTSYLRTTLEWLNQYENLKKYEIDHKKATAAYAWTFTFDDVRSFKQWLALSDDDKKKTAIMAKITPGSKLILPPGVKCEAKVPNLTKISDSDTDILELISSGLNVTTDSMMGKTSAPYSGSKAGFTPMSDRISDEVSYFDTFLKYDFWSAIFFLKNKIVGYPEKFDSEEVVGWDKKGKEIVKKVKKLPEHLMDVSFPGSAYEATEDKAKAMLGVKHGNISETLGIPSSEIAKKLGFAGYGKQRLKKATEDLKYPELVYTIDDEAKQEKVEAEPGKKKNTKGGD